MTLLVPKSVTVVVTGGRDYTDRARVYEVLDGLGVTHLATGACPTGADRLAEEWAAARDIPTTQYRADWSTGRSAGPKRNRLMLSTFHPGLVVAFPGGRGTADCVKAAQARGIGVLHVDGHRTDDRRDHDRHAPRTL